MTDVVGDWRARIEWTRDGGLHSFTAQGDTSKEALSTLLLAVEAKKKKLRINWFTSKIVLMPLAVLGMEAEAP